MEKAEVRDFANYEVYEYVDNNYHCICLCDKLEAAINIAKTLARMDPVCDKYYVSNVSEPGTFTWGGGWYYCYWWDKKENKLRQDTLM